MAEMTLDVETLRSLVAYNPETGVFTRLVKRDFNPKSVLGKPLGTAYSNGYLGFRVLTRRYLSHRLAWFYVHGEWPQSDMDHVNGDRTDNRLCNLRLATKSQNMANTETQVNNTSGHRGVIFDKVNKKWMAYMQQHGKFINLGRFVVKEEAIAVRAQAFASAFGKFAGRQSSIYQ
jgi:hypothetical protein